MDKCTQNDLPASNTEGNSVLADQARELLNQSNLKTSNGCDEFLKNGKPESLDELSHLNSETLSCLYANSPAGHMIHGDTTGKGIFLPGTEAGELISKLGNKVWTGKVFEENGQLVNKILGHKLVKADVLRGPSWSDGKESIIIDYKNKSLAAGWVRDEIREVQPGLYLGKMYARLPFHKHTDVLFFALESNKK